MNTLILANIGDQVMENPKPEEFRKEHQVIPDKAKIQTQAFLSFRVSVLMGL